MLFNTFAFWLFFALVLAINFGGPANWSRAVLVIASFTFYSMWGASLVPLLGFCAVFNWVAGLLIGRHRQDSSGRWLLFGAIAVNLSILGFFKYYRLLLDAGAHLVHVTPVMRLDVFLPVAISFYTFESIAYTVDVYRGDVKARRSLLDFTLFLSFFPHLVAGPIIRPAYFFPQVAGRPVPSSEDISWGALQIVKGLVKKCVFADNFAAIANPYFNGDIDHPGAWTAWTATLAFSLQIYFDFSGYTDIARGCARLLGYDFPPNFERPYLARNITEFWRRWHISLSTWLRDYLYIPLGGNRRGKVRTYFNLMITMGLGGLWHGANWNFLLWGVFHGALLCGHRLWTETRGSVAEPGAASRALMTVLTFLAVTMGWVTFRTSDFGQTAQVYRELFMPQVPPSLASSADFLILSGASVLWVAIDRGRGFQSWLRIGDGPLGFAKVAAAFCIGLLVLEFFTPSDVSAPFIYFRF